MSTRLHRSPFAVFTLATGPEVEDLAADQRAKSSRLKAWIVYTITLAVSLVPVAVPCASSTRLLLLGHFDPPNQCQPFTVSIRDIVESVLP